jgi:hypothetical protein
MSDCLLLSASKFTEARWQLIQGPFSQLGMRPAADVGHSRTKESLWILSSLWRYGINSYVNYMIVPIAGL